MVKLTTKLTVNKLVSSSKKNYILAVLVDKNGKPVSNVNIGFADSGVKYVATDKDGKARYFIDHLKVGKHTISVAFWGNDQYNASEKIPYSFWIGKIPTKLNVWRDGNYIISKLTDADNHPLKNLNVGFADNGVKYVKTNNNGEAKYSIAHFGYGTFTIKIAFWGNDAYKATAKIPCKFTNEPPKSKAKKYGRSLKTGCDNRGQNNDYYCGPHMAQEIVRNLTGIVVSQSTIASVMGTTSNGTGHQGINTFFAWFNRKYGKNLQVTWKNFTDIGWSGVNNILNSNNKDIGVHEKYKDTWGHYTNFDNVYNSTIDVHNSLGDYCSSGCHCGYEENRSKSTAERYMSGISQKSIIIVTNEG